MTIPLFNCIICSLRYFQGKIFRIIHGFYETYVRKKVENFTFHSMKPKLNSFICMENRNTHVCLNIFVTFRS